MALKQNFSLKSSTEKKNPRKKVQKKALKNNFFKRNIEILENNFFR